jgi:6-phosphogluconolactonase
MNPNVKIFHNTRQLAEDFAAEIIRMARDAHEAGKPCTIMLSGGSTPKALFEAIVKLATPDTPWDQVHLYWGDERCVPPDDAESNYLMTRQTLLDKINIPEKNIYRIKGESEPTAEARRYAEKLLSVNPDNNGTPVFDLVILGMGDDGHTASVFPDNLRIFQSENLCETAANPYSGQQRITVTPRVINNAKRIVFMVTGKNKAGVLKETIEKKGNYSEYPASHINPTNGELVWYIDEEAGKSLSLPGLSGK